MESSERNTLPPVGEKHNTCTVVTVLIMYNYLYNYAVFQAPKELAGYMYLAKKSKVTNKEHHHKEWEFQLSHLCMYTV